MRSLNPTSTSPVCRPLCAPRRDGDRSREGKDAAPCLAPIGEMDRACHGPLFVGKRSHREASHLVAGEPEPIRSPEPDWPGRNRRNGTTNKGRCEFEGKRALVEHQLERGVKQYRSWPPGARCLDCFLATQARSLKRGSSRPDRDPVEVNGADRHGLSVYASTPQRPCARRCSTHGGRSRHALIHHGRGDAGFTGVTQRRGVFVPKRKRWIARARNRGPSATRYFEARL